MTLSVKKKNGEVRIIVDFRNLNKTTKPSSYPLPDVNESLSRLYGMKSFSCFDLKSGYCQIMLCEARLSLTSFVINGGQFEFIRLPFGINNAPHSFQRAINLIIKDVHCVRAYLDDILIASKNEREPVKDIELVLKRLNENNMAINFEKSHFFKKEIELLGRKINAQGIKANTTRVVDFHLKNQRIKENCKD